MSTFIYAGTKFEAAERVTAKDFVETGRIRIELKDGRTVELTTGPGIPVAVFDGA